MNARAQWFGLYRVEDLHVVFVRQGQVVEFRSDGLAFKRCDRTEERKIDIGPKGAGSLGPRPEEAYFGYGGMPSEHAAHHRDFRRGQGRVHFRFSSERNLSNASTPEVYRSRLA
jgi:hypothetical protein